MEEIKMKYYTSPQVTDLSETEEVNRGLLDFTFRLNKTMTELEIQQLIEDNDKESHPVGTYYKQLPAVDDNNPLYAFPEKDKPENLFPDTKWIMVHEEAKAHVKIGYPKEMEFDRFGGIRQANVHCFSGVDDQIIRDRTEELALFYTQHSYDDFTFLDSDDLEKLAIDLDIILGASELNNIAFIALAVSARKSMNAFLAHIIMGLGIKIDYGGLSVKTELDFLYDNQIESLRKKNRSLQNEIEELKKQALKSQQQKEDEKKALEKIIDSTKKLIETLETENKRLVSFAIESNFNKELSEWYWNNRNMLNTDGIQKTKPQIPKWKLSMEGLKTSYQVASQDFGETPLNEIIELVTEGSKIYTDIDKFVENLKDSIVKKSIKGSIVQSGYHNIRLDINSIKYDLNKFIYYVKDRIYSLNYTDTTSEEIAKKEAQIASNNAKIADLEAKKAAAKASQDSADAATSNDTIDPCQVGLYFTFLDPGSTGSSKFIGWRSIQTILQYCGSNWSALGPKYFPAVNATVSAWPSGNSNLFNQGAAKSSEVHKVIDWGKGTYQDKMNEYIANLDLSWLVYLLDIAGAIGEFIPMEIILYNPSGQFRTYHVGFDAAYTQKSGDKFVSKNKKCILWKRVS
jgi:peptidoglycan hydrolase CwlO-like protein